jgi:polysaccharide export outer membrane protein
VWFAWLFGAMLLVMGQSSFAQSGAQSNYKLGAGDVISIRVFGEDDLSRDKIQVTDAGTVPYPVLGELKILGRTVGELERQVTDGLRGRYLVNPRVAVTIDQYRPFFINGQVASPGAYPYQPGLSVAKAVALAGGLKERASVDKMFVVREQDTSRTRVKVDMNNEILPGDVLTIEASFF